MDTKAFFKLSYGLYIISTENEGKQAGCIANTFNQVTSSPAQVSVTLNKNNATEQMIEKSGKFAVAVLEQSATMELIGRFGFHCSRDLDKFSGLDCGIDEQGLPFVKEHAASRFSCKVVKTVDLGTHVMFIAEVAGCEVATTHHAHQRTFRKYCFDCRLYGLLDEPRREQQRYGYRQPSYQQMERVRTAQGSVENLILTKRIQLWKFI